MKQEKEIRLDFLANFPQNHKANALLHSQNVPNPNTLDSAYLSQLSQDSNDKGLDKAVEDISTMQEILKDNNLNIVSQNGVILQISSKTMNEKLGSLGVAYFASAYSSMSINADSNRMRLIINSGNSYYELVDKGDSFSFKASSKADYDKYSLIASLEGGSDAHKLVTTALMLSEVPIGYARTFYLKHGNLNLGITGKLMNAISTQKQININKNTVVQKELSSLAEIENTISSNNYGVVVWLL